MKIIRAVAITLVAFASVASGQELRTGKWTGTRVEPTNAGGRPTGLVLVIHDIQAEVVKATATETYQVHGNGGPACSGDYRMEGKYRDNKLRLRSTSTTARSSDCRLSLNLSLEGDKLVGTTGGGYPVMLSR